MGWAHRLFPHHRLLAEQDGSGCASGRHAEMWAGLVLGDRVPDAADGGPGILVNGGRT